MSESFSCSWSFFGRFRYTVDHPNFFHGQASAISEFDEILVLGAQRVDGFPQTFQLEVPERRILHGTPDTLQAGQHRFKLTFTQMTLVPLILCPFPFPILL